METVVNITLWGENVGALAWDENQEIGVLEFYEAIAKQNQVPPAFIQQVQSNLYLHL